MNKRSRGFTLLELMVVIVIIVVLAVVVVPLLGGSDHRRLTDAAAQLVMLVNLAQQEAILSSSILQLEFDFEESGYRFAQLNGSDFIELTTRPLAGTHPLNAISMQSLEINGRVTIEDRAGIYLYPTGEQEPFQLLLTSGEERYLVGMGAVGEAWMEAL
jgi:type II secretion system protein H